MQKKKKKALQRSSYLCKRRSAQSSFQNQFNAKLQFHFPKNKNYNLYHMFRLSTYPLCFFKFDTFFHSKKCVNKVMDHNNKTGGIETL